jgi:hypothetical protein
MKPVLYIDVSVIHWFVRLVYSSCSQSEHRASVKRFVSLQFLNLRHSVGFLGRVISSSQDRYLKETHNKHKTDIHASSGVRTHHPSVRAGEDSSCPRPRGHCDRQCLSLHSDSAVICSVFVSDTRIGSDREKMKKILCIDNA